MVEIMLTRSRIQACFSGRETLTFVPLASIPAVQAREGAVNNTIIIFTLRQYDKIRCEFIILIRNCDSYCIFKIRWGDRPYLYQCSPLKGVVSFFIDK
ncbi:hypothetical protein FML04_02485 [Klebsiella oxytoca]|nr:hypothetical protein [Klebsiella oxytoca]PLL99201.1 hypothetical protein CWN68_08845 [Klebsiella michiganensis]MBZ6765830.1 hypothetical protein [Klebsiella oxytoca]MBZ7310191.1 hypothetical protein [Klebsiella oxytoca]MBZ7523685.1 hypothetical protein [Klebsiella oxytoca]